MYSFSSRFKACRVASILRATAASLSKYSHSLAASSVGGCAHVIERIVRLAESFLGIAIFLFYSFSVLKLQITRLVCLPLQLLVVIGLH
jgi:hypothetical protein